VNSSPPRTSESSPRGYSPSQPELSKDSSLKLDAQNPLEPPTKRAMARVEVSFPKMAPEEKT